MINKKFTDGMIFIISLIIPLLILGPFFPDLILSFFSLIFLIYVFKNKLFFYFTKKPLIIFFIFCFYCILVSTFVSIDVSLSFESSLFYFRIGIFSCLIWYLLEQNKKILSYFYYSLVISFSVLVVDGYIQFFIGNNILGFPIIGDPGTGVFRLSSFFHDELILGSYLSRLFPLLFALFVIKKKKKYELYCIGILFILTDVLIFISGERASFALLNLSTIFIIVLIKEYQKFRLLTFVVTSLFIVSVTYLHDDLNKRMITKTIEEMGLTNNSKQKYIFSLSHDSLFRTAYNMFLDKPLVGHGPKMFRVICKDEKYADGITPCATHPHNFYVQLLAETGIIGFSFLFSIFIYVLYCAYRQFRSVVLRQERYLTDYQVCLLAGILITVWPITTNGNFFHNWLMIAYTLPLGFYLHSLYGKNKDKLYKNQN